MTAETALHEPHPSLTSEDASSLRSRKWESAKVGLYSVAFYATVLCLEAIFPRTRHLVWDMIGPGIVLAAVGAVRYLREFHPAMLPPPLEYDSPLQRKLSRTKNILAIAFLATMVLGIIAAFATNCSCEDHPVLFIAWLVTFAGSILGSLGVAAYLGLRTLKPQPNPGPASYWPRAPRPISEYKPFQSEHWGSQGN